MKIIQPAVIDDAALTSTNVPEADYPAWSAATAYTVGQRVMRAVTGVHRNFECLANVGPTATTPENDPTKWLDLGATNRWAMFDTKIGTQTSNTDSIVVELTHAQPITGVALFGVAAQTARVQRIQGVTVLYDKEVNMTDFSLVYDYWTYFFSPVSQRSDIVFTDIPPYVGGVVTKITIDNTGSTAKCGAAIVGSIFEIGQTVEGSSYEYQDFSTISEDVFGVYSITKRGLAKRASWQVAIPRVQVNAARAIINSVASIPTVFIGSEEFEGMILFGLSGRPKFDHESHPIIRLTLDIKGII